MFDRRSFLLSSAALAASFNSVRAASTRVFIPPETKQGALIVGRAEPGAMVALDSKRLSVSADGHFAFGFPYDRKSPAKIAVQFADGAMETFDVLPGIRKYEVQRIDGLPEDYVSPPPDILERIKREAELNASIRARDNDHPWFADAFDWPAHGIVSSIYGSQRILNGKPQVPHLGVDIAAPMGTPIQAPADGIVSLTAEQYLNGGFTMLDHGHGVSTLYLHQSKRLVKDGDKVSRGQMIGEIGQTGRATGPNLHWAMFWFQVGLDPSLATSTSQPPKD
jgi:murein DD-endopeptidase MepM/ murein hydrolase activator NlpD